MKAIILAGGFAKRLWPLTKNYPKPLLKVGNKAIIDHIIEKVLEVEDIERIYITTNSAFEMHFSNELNEHLSKENIDLVIEPSSSEENKLGSLGAINHIIKKEGIDDDLLVVAGDNLFGFNINDLVSYYKENGRPVIAFYDIKDMEKVRNRYGNVKLDESGKVIDFVEKPASPHSTLVSTGCYIFPKRILPLILLTTYI
ncbi:MAG: nucleotidyltransferase family protein, partial [Candidatus Micrarchaeota archaeon]|nr:nucleotidyltransferase family protein [Candidatus Micrarchaeota archaeon]